MPAQPPPSVYTIVRALRAEADAPLLEREEYVAVEEPLEIRIAGESLAVTMRTPGHDHELVAGFLLAEGLIASAADLGTVAHCGRPSDEGYGNVIDVAPGPGASFDWTGSPAHYRGTLMTSACGVCGRRSIDDLLARCKPIADATRFTRSTLTALADSLRDHQRLFQLTGGVHAAAVADANGHFGAVREDVGRHNAVDKVAGRLLLDGALEPPGKILVVSGRTSFEIVQKAVAARFAAVVGVSAPSSLAIATAERANVTLLGFARGDTFNAYAGRERIAV